MYKISVPIVIKTLERYGSEDYIKKLKEMGAERVFLAIDSYIVDDKVREKTFEDLGKYVSEFKNAGFEVGVWIWTFMVVGDKKYTHIASPNGAVAADEVCPSDDKFREFASDYIRDIAKLHPDMIMYDDDYRYGFLDCGLGCACENHRKFMSDLLGEKLPAGLADRIFDEIFSERENIVLIGMASSGKSTVGKMLAERLGRKFYDTDALIVERLGMGVAEIFDKHGEDEFRRIEREVVSDIAKESGVVIATGGGTSLYPTNMKKDRKSVV